MVCTHLVTKNHPILCLTAVFGVHRQVHRWPVVQKNMWYGNQAQTFNVLKVGELPFPVLLGCNAPGFGTLVKSAIHDVAIVEEEELPEIEDDSPDHDPNAFHTSWAAGPQFLRAQQSDNSLDQLFEAIVVSEGAPLEQR